MEALVSHHPGVRLSVEVTGSARLQTQSSGSDCDVVVVARYPGSEPPLHADAVSMLQTLGTLLRDSASCQWVVADTVQIRTNAVPPLVAFQAAGTPPIDVDVQFVWVPVQDPRNDMILRVPSTSVPSVQALRFPLALEQMLKGRWPLFQRVLRLVRAWAGARQLTGNSYGMLGGVSWAILVAFTVLHSPAETAWDGFRAFVLTFAHWEWPIPVMLGIPNIRPALALVEEGDRPTTPWFPPTTAPDHHYLSLCDAARLRSAKTPVFQLSVQAVEEKKSVSEQKTHPSTILFDIPVPLVPLRRFPERKGTNASSFSSVPAVGVPASNPIPTPTPTPTLTPPVTVAVKSPVSTTVSQATKPSSSAAAARTPRPDLRLSRNAMPIILPMIPHTNTAYNASSEFADRFRRECLRAWSLVQTKEWTHARASTAWTSLCEPYRSTLPCSYDLHFEAPAHLLDKWIARCVSQAWRLLDILHASHPDIHVECGTENKGVWPLHLQLKESLQENTPFWTDKLKDWLGYMLPRSDWPDCGVRLVLCAKNKTVTQCMVHS
jgi:hypothetical protein